jgi:hypothetical protein
MSKTLLANWLEAKELEQSAARNRRLIEDALIEMYGIDPSVEGTTSKTEGEYKCKATTRLSRKVDGDLLQEIAAENGVSEHLGTLFRWKPEINAKAWKDADSKITDILLAAITTKPGRPTFKVELIEEEK